MREGTVTVGYLDPDTWATCFGMSFRDLLLVDALGSAEYRARRRIVPNGREIRKYCTTDGIVSGRNQLAANMLDKTDTEWLFMPDTDMGFGPTTVDDLIASADPKHAPVVGGLCFSLRQEGVGPFYSTICDEFPTIYDWYEDETQVGFIAREDYERNAVIQCDATGGALLLIHRTVLERIREQYGDHWFDKIPHNKAPDGMFGEDLSFCMRLAALEIPLFVNTAVKTAHYKGPGRYLTEESYDRQLIAVAAEAGLFFTGWLNLFRSCFVPSKQGPWTLDNLSAKLRAVPA